MHYPKETFDNSVFLLCFWYQLFVYYLFLNPHLYCGVFWFLSIVLCFSLDFTSIIYETSFSCLFIVLFMYIFFWSITYTKRELGWKAYSHYFYHFSSYVDARLFVDHDQASRLYSVANEEERPCGRTCPCLPLQDRARSDPYVFSLATNPFYLWLICTIFTEAGEEFVPKTLTQLYTWVMLVFAHRWVQCQTSFGRAAIIYSTLKPWYSELSLPDPFCSLYQIIHYCNKCNMLSKSSRS